MLATKIPINIDRNSCACVSPVADLISDYDITVADTDTCCHNVICRVAAAVNRYVISDVYNILGDNVFVRTSNVGMVKQHVGLKCDKPWLISVKLSLVGDPGVGITEGKQPEEKRCNDKPNSNIEIKDQNIEVKDQNVDNVVSNKDVIDDRDKTVNSPKDNSNSKDNLINETKDVQEGVVRCKETSSDVTTPRPTFMTGDKDNLKTTEIEPCEDKQKRGVS